MRLLIVLALIIASILIASTPSHAQDVYNFYFQKNQGAAPTVGPAVVPGPVQPGAVSSAPAAATPVVETELKPIEKKDDLKKWEIGFYSSSINSYVKETSRYSYTQPETYDSFELKDGLSFIGSYRFSKYYAAELGATWLNGWAEDDNSMREIDDGKGFQGLLGFVITPIHINFFGYELLEIAGTIGGMSVKEYETLKTDSGLVDGDSSDKIIIYAGPRLSINLTSELALVADYKKGFGDHSGMGNLGLRWRL